MTSRHVSYLAGLCPALLLLCGSLIFLNGCEARCRNGEVLDSLFLPGTNRQEILNRLEKASLTLSRTRAAVADDFFARIMVGRMSQQEQKQAVTFDVVSPVREGGCPLSNCSEYWIFYNQDERVVHAYLRCPPD